MTTPLPFRWPHALVFWAVYVWVFIPEFRVMGRAPLTTPAPVEDRGSLRVIVVGFSLATLAAFGLPFAAPGAALLIVLGIALSLGNWLGVVVSLAFAFPAYAYRAHVEEKALLASLGEPYARFMASRKRFIPYVY